MGNIRKSETHGRISHGHFGTIKRIYEAFHRPEYIYPDPLHIVRQYDTKPDQEIVGLLCASLALGRVQGILQAAGGILAVLPEPAREIGRYSMKDFLELFHGFRYRFFGNVEIASFMTGIKRIRETHGTLESCFLKFYERSHETVMPALIEFVRVFSGYAENRHGLLLPNPEKGGASKRLHLFLRWMVRKDLIDPGCWQSVSASHLVYPLDTHMLTVAGHFGLCTRSTADLKTALTVTQAFRHLCPEDPVRFDFSLTRPGIHPMLSVSREYATDAMDN